MTKGTARGPSPSSCDRASVLLQLATTRAELRECVVEERCGLFVGAPLLHVGEVRLVRLELRHRRRVLAVATGGQAGRRAVDDVGDLLFGQTRREVAHGLVALRVPVADRDAVGVEASVLFAHRARADARAANGAVA